MKLSPEFLSDDAAAAVARAGNDVFLLVMDGPLDMASQALELVQRIFPRILTIRSAAFCWDLVLLEVRLQNHAHPIMDRPAQDRAHIAAPLMDARMHTSTRLRRF